MSAGTLAIAIGCWALSAFSGACLAGFFRALWARDGETAAFCLMFAIPLSGIAIVSIATLATGGQP